MRRSVLGRKVFDPEPVTALAAEAKIAEMPHAQVVNYTRQEFVGLREGNVMRYRLRYADPEAINQT